MDLFASLRSRDDGQRVHSRPRSTHLIRFKTRSFFFLNNKLQGGYSVFDSPRTNLCLLAATIIFAIYVSCTLSFSCFM